MSRSRTRERRLQREREQRRQQRITIAVVVAVIAVAAFAVFFLANQPAEAAIPQEALDLYAAIPQSETSEGFPILGNPDAPVELIEYSSFDCPHCRDFHETVTPALVERVRNGELSFTYVPLYGTGGIANGEGAARAAICAGEQGQFWPMHSALFTWQGLYGNQAFSGNRLSTGAGNLGLNRGEWDTCFNSQATNGIINAARTRAASLGDTFTGTPFVQVNGTAVTPELGALNSAIDAALATSGPVTPLDMTDEPTAEVMSEATVEATATEAATEAAITEATAEATEE
jgi:protein-disulfide isomerase